MLRCSLARGAAVAALVGLSLSGCGHNFVKVDAPLGRVVVYRNGVAYFERRAHVAGNELTLSVPKDKVDDFLKSLTVRDAKTGKSLPIAFPSQGTTHGSAVDMVIKLPDNRSADLLLTYISAAPAWKPSYRVEVGKDGKVRLQGWAVVDNTSGEDWVDVLVGVGSSSALSFRYDLWTIRDIERQTLASEDRFALAPPSGGSSYREGSAVLAELEATEIPLPDGHPERGGTYGNNDSDIAQRRVTVSSKAEPAPPPAAAAGEGGGETRHSGETSRPAIDPVEDDSKKKVRRLADTVVRNRHKIVIEGVGDKDDADPAVAGLDRANVLKNQLIVEGVPPAQIEVRTAIAKEGERRGVRVVAEPNQVAARDPQKEQSADPIGESHFESGVPISVPRESSVMVSIVDGSTDGRVVYLYDPESARGNDRFAFRAVRVANPTASALEAGPVTVYGSEGFIGEGITEPIPPKSTALVPFALDRQVIVEHTEETNERIARLITIERGVLTSEIRHVKTQQLKVTNRLETRATVFLRHTVQPGWKLEKSPKKSERLGAAHLFPIELDPGQTKTVTLEEATPMMRTIDLRSPAGMSMVAVYLENATADAAVADSMRKLLVLHREIADNEEAIASLRTRMDDFRVRMDELHGQIVTLKAVKSGGPLMKHLNVKMKDVSERVQKATIEVVDRQEKLMLARIKFQDAVAELSLAAPAGDTTKVAKQP